MSKITVLLDTKFGFLSDIGVIVEPILKYNLKMENKGFDEDVREIYKIKYLLYGLYKVVLKSKGSKNHLKTGATNLFSLPPISNNFKIKGLK